MNGFRKSHAVVIGIDDYSNGIPALRTAVNDACKIAEILETNFGYEVETLTSDVSAERIRDIFTNRLAKAVENDDRLLIYFAGHGIALEGDDGPTGYLIPQDAKREDRGTFVPMTDLNGWLNALPCRHMLLVMDCCFAGAFRWASTRDMGAPPDEIYKERFDRFIRDPAWQVLTSAAHDQKALDNLGDRGVDKDLPNHSPFAAALIRGLSGDADAYPKRKDGEKSGDGVITASELYMYLRDEVEVSAEAIDHSQTPGLWPLKKHDRGEYVHVIPGYELDLQPAPQLDVSANPYRGLQSYDFEHASLFFGRKAVVRKLARRVEDQPLTIVLGASGTGKSSVVKAGLVSYLRNPNDDSAGSGKSTKNSPAGPPIDRYAILKPIRPGKSPLSSLTELSFAPEKNGETEPVPYPLKTPLQSLKTDPVALSATIGTWFEANATCKLVLIVDQFEELITLCMDEAERKMFMSQLEQAIRTHPNRLRVVVTLRSDFEPQFADKLTKDQWNDWRFVVPAMTPSEYREVIEGPASVRVLYFKACENRTSQEFIDRIIGDIANTPGALPLLSFTLSELYRCYVQSGSDDRALQESDYETLGGVGGSLRQRADEIYAEMPDSAHRETMKKVMLRMISAEGGGLARRRAARDELIYASEDENQRVEVVLSKLVAARLVIQDKDEEDRPVLEPAHDKLVNGWSRLQEWRRQEMSALQLREVLVPAVEDWSRDEEKDKGKLWDDNPRLSLLAEELGLSNRWHSYQIRRLKKLYDREVEIELLEIDSPEWMQGLIPRDESNSTWLNATETLFVHESISRRHAWTTTVAILTVVVISVFSGLTWYAKVNEKVAVLRQIDMEKRIADGYLLKIGRNPKIIDQEEMSTLDAISKETESIRGFVLARPLESTEDDEKAALRFQNRHAYVVNAVVGLDENRRSKAIGYVLETLKKEMELQRSNGIRNAALNRNDSVRKSHDDLIRIATYTGFDLESYDSRSAVDFARLTTMELIDRVVRLRVDPKDDSDLSAYARQFELVIPKFEGDLVSVSKKIADSLQLPSLPTNKFYVLVRMAKAMTKRLAPPYDDELIDISSRVLLRNTTNANEIDDLYWLVHTRKVLASDSIAKDPVTDTSIIEVAKMRIASVFGDRTNFSIDFSGNNGNSGSAVASRVRSIMNEVCSTDDEASDRCWSALSRRIEGESTQSMNSTKRSALSQFYLTLDTEYPGRLDPSRSIANKLAISMSKFLQINTNSSELSSIESVAEQLFRTASPNVRMEIATNFIKYYQDKQEDPIHGRSSIQSRLTAGLIRMPVEDKTFLTNAMQMIRGKLNPKLPASNLADLTMIASAARDSDKNSAQVCLDEITVLAKSKLNDPNPMNVASAVFALSHSLRSTNPTAEDLRSIAGGIEFCIGRKKGISGITMVRLINALSVFRKLPNDAPSDYDAVSRKLSESVADFLRDGLCSADDLSRISNALMQLDRMDREIWATTPQSVAECIGKKMKSKSILVSEFGRLLESAPTCFGMLNHNQKQRYAEYWTTAAYQNPHIYEIQLNSPQTLNGFFGDLVEHLSEEWLLDFLANPFCVGRTQTIVLDEFGKRRNAKFVGLWHFVRAEKKIR